MGWSSYTRWRGQAALAAVALVCLAARAAGEPVTLCFEAEHANDLTFPFEIVECAETSGGLAITLPEGAGSYQAFRGDPGTATYSVAVPVAGSYRLCLRVRWNGTCSNSIVADAARKSWVATSDVLGRWHWVRAARPVDLAEGVIEVRLRNREDGVWVDQLLLTTEDLELTDARFKPGVIPAAPAHGQTAPLAFVTCAAGGAGLLPPTDFKLRHSTGATVHLDRVPRCVLRSSSPTPLVVWLRNNALTEATGKVSLLPPGAVAVTPDSTRAFHISPGEPLHAVRFELAPQAELRRGVHSLLVQVQHADGKLAAQRLLLERPFAWLVTDAMVCPKSGLDTPSPVEDHVADGFPGTVEGVSWRAAADAAVTPFGLLDLRRAVGDKTHVMAYAYTRVESPQDMQAQLDVRHDDMARVWLNGDEVFSSEDCLPSVLTRKLVKVGLRKGENHLLVKICQQKNYWELGAWFLSSDGKPAPVFGMDVPPAPTGENRK